MKDALDPEEKCCVVYECKCEECRYLYVSEMESSLDERSEEHDMSLKEGD